MCIVFVHLFVSGCELLLKPSYDWNEEQNKQHIYLGVIWDLSRSFKSISFLADHVIDLKNCDHNYDSVHSSII
jgi:hypothetical protein